MATGVEVRAPTLVRHRGRGTVLILLSAASFGTSGTIAKPAMLAGLSPEQVAAARISLAALVLVLGVAVFRPWLLRVRRVGWPILVGYGLLGVAGVQLGYFLSVRRLPVGIAILLEFASPVLIALWTRFVRRIRLPGRIWLGIALATGGLVLVAQVWDGLRLDALGLLMGLGTAVCSAAYFLLGEHGATTRDPLGMVTWGCPRPSRRSWACSNPSSRSCWRGRYSVNRSAACSSPARPCCSAGRPSCSSATATVTRAALSARSSGGAGRSRPPNGPRPGAPPARSGGCR